MPERADKQSWVQVVENGEAALRHFVRNKMQPLGKYFGSSVLWHYTESGKVSAKEADLKIEAAAIKLAKKAIESLEMVEQMGAEDTCIKDDHLQMVRSFANARQNLHDEIMQQFRLASIVDGVPPSYWDFNKKEFDATAQMFEARLSKDITDFLYAARQHYREGGMAAGGHGGRAG